MANREQPKVLTKKHLARQERERQQNFWIVISSAVVLLAVIGLIGYGILDQTVLLMNKPVIKVGEDVINVKEFQKQVSLARAQKIQQYNWYYTLSQSFGADQFAQTLNQLQSQLDNPQSIGSEVLDTLTNDLLIRQEAAKRGITVSPEEIDQKMHEMYSFYPNGTPTASLTPTTYFTPTYNPTQLIWEATRPAPTNTVTLTPEFTATLEFTPTATIEMTPTTGITETPTPEPTATLEPTATATEIPATPTSSVPTATFTPSPSPTPYTLEGYQAMLAKNLEPYAKFGYTEADYRKTIEIDLLKQKLGEALAGTNGKHEAEEVWARHILVADAATAQIVLERLKAGEDWGALAAQFSTDTSNKDNNGDLGWFGRGQMVTEFEDASFALNVGQTSEPVKTAYGYHIIQLLGKRLKPMTDYEWQNYLDTLVTQYLSKIKAERTDIQTFDIWQEVVPTEPTLADFYATN